jgi:hypothetical protein
MNYFIIYSRRVVAKGNIPAVPEEKKDSEKEWGGDKKTGKIL